MKILLTVASLLPKHGGPAFSVSQLAVALTKAGAEVGLWSPDGSAAETPLLAEIDGIIRLTGPEAQALARFGRPDVMHDNGIWLPHNHRLAQAAAALETPRLVSTRGMLEPWARRHKAWKKVVAWQVYQRRDLRRAGRLHATAQVEAENLETLNLRVPITTIPNGLSIPLLPPGAGSRSAKASTPRTALFIGRIYPVKGLPMLVQAWAKTQPPGWRLRIAGPDEGGHKAQVQRAVNAAGLENVVEFVGPLDGQEKRNAFLEAELLVLPSLSESFGMAVGEGLAHGLPVLTTTAVPWPSLARQGCGWAVEPTVEGLAGGLAVATGAHPAELRAMGARGRAVIASEFSWEGVAGAFGRLYESLVAEPRTRDRNHPPSAIYNVQ